MKNVNFTFKYETVDLIEKIVGMKKLKENLLHLTAKKPRFFEKESVNNCKL